jgi:glycosyltransferase involved in cell wall biosynthesis
LTDKPRKVLFIERKPHDFVSIERVFRQIAVALSSRYDNEFQQMPYGNSPTDTLRNLLFFRKRNADIYHITGHVHYIALRLSPTNTVLTIHDVRFLDEPSRLKRWILKKLYLDRPVKRLKYITAISEKTKRAIIDATGCDESKIRVIPVPLIGDLKKNKTAKAFDAAKPRILQVGTMKNKNVPRLIEALDGTVCHLRIIGKMDEEQRRALARYSVEYSNDVDLDDASILKEYEEADIVAFCSTLEGFGLPIIEAQAMGKPVVTSNMEPMNETSGMAAVLVDPFDVISIRDGIRSVIENEDLRREIVEKGKKNIERFAPAIIAAQYERLYDEIRGK